MSVPLKPRLGLDLSTLPPSSFPQAAAFDIRTRTSLSHLSNFRSSLLEMQLLSPSIKVIKHSGLDGMLSRPVFGDHDKVEGKVILDPSCSQNGRLTITIEGVFEYVSVRKNIDDEYALGPNISKHRNTFFSSSTIILVSHISSPLSTFGVRKRSSQLNLNSPTPRSCQFSFELPRGNRPGEEIPPTFSSSVSDVDGRGIQSFVEKAEVSYRITAIWEASDMSQNSGILEVPIIFHPDTDFHSIDGSEAEPELWLEIPLRPERLIPFRCAITLPHPETFSRCSSVPYFVVFSTTPQCPARAREIAADATIAVSLIRKITIEPQRSSDGMQLGDDSDGSSCLFPTPRNKLVKRAGKTGAHVALRTRTSEESLASAARHKPLPELPQVSFSETRTIKTQVHIGFPKRPRLRGCLESQPLLPDGLYKGKIQLPQDMLSAVDWPGVNVKYYLDVSVLFAQDVLGARVPIRVL